MFETQRARQWATYGGVAAVACSLAGAFSIGSAHYRGPHEMTIPIKYKLNNKMDSPARPDKIIIFTLDLSDPSFVTAEVFDGRAKDHESQRREGGQPFSVVFQNPLNPADRITAGHVLDLRPALSTAGDMIYFDHWWQTRASVPKTLYQPELLPKYMTIEVPQGRVDNLGCEAPGLLKWVFPKFFREREFFNPLVNLSFPASTNGPDKK